MATSIHQQLYISTMRQNSSRDSQAVHAPRCCLHMEGRGSATNHWHHCDPVTAHAGPSARQQKSWVAQKKELNGCPLDALDCTGSAPPLAERVRSPDSGAPKTEALLVGVLPPWLPLFSLVSLMSHSTFKLSLHTCSGCLNLVS